MDNTTLVGLTRLWGQAEKEPKTKVQATVLQSYSNQDLTRLLESWGCEWDLCDLEKFFTEKLNALCENYATRNGLQNIPEENQKKVLEAMQLLKQFCEERNCVHCPIREKIGCQPAWFKASIPQNWKDVEVKK